MRRSRRPLVLGVVVIAAVLGFLIYQGISNNLVYYITPSELLAKGAEAEGQSFRVGGRVRPGSVHWNSAKRTLRFVLSDPKGAIPVESQGIPPQLFQAGAGCVVEGTFLNHRFDATTLMIKHGADYRAPKPGNTPVPDSYVNKP